MIPARLLAAIAEIRAAAVDAGLVACVPGLHAEALPEWARDLRPLSTGGVCCHGEIGGKHTVCEPFEITETVCLIVSRLATDAEARADFAARPQDHYRTCCVDPANAPRIAPAMADALAPFAPAGSEVRRG